MAGAIAGTAILRAPKRTDQVHTVALTINNRCNLACPHCYLQYEGREGVINQETLEAILSSEFEHLAIVGKEPLVDTRSIELVTEITHRVRTQGRTVSVITNGLSLGRVPAETLEQLAYVDVSLDGGVESYRAYRRGSLRKLTDGLRQASEIVELNALHVVSSATLHAIDDMAAVGALAPFRRIMLSPYLVTSNHGLNTVAPVELFALLTALSESMSFRSSSNAFLLVDGLHLHASGALQAAVTARAEDLGIGHQVRIISSDPLLNGFLRVNYDGLVLAPLDSLNPALYTNCAAHILDGSLESHFSRFQAKLAA